MFGSMIGNLAGISYFLSFQILGILLALYLFQKEKLCLTMLLGSVLGSFALHWLPTLYAFFFHFTIRAHIFAFLTFVALVWIVAVRSKSRSILNGRKIRLDVKTAFLENPALFLLIPLLIFVYIVLLRCTIPYIDGAMHSGQSTYGDMNMHLGFITSIANQKVFPPDYSILPGTRLAYPFLSDSISSSVYIWGTSLRIAYLVPMFFAMVQVFFGVYTLAKKIIQHYGGSFRGKSFLAVTLFFFNGGLGFIYFMNEGLSSENFTRIFTAFYETPTNYVQSNIQWHNIICDMLIPQRATLFGWAMLFPILILLWKAVQEKSRRYFVIAGILAGGLPLIHTHSFLALGVLCAGYVILDLITNGKKPWDRPVPVWGRLILVAAALTGLTYISIRQMSDTPVDANVLLGIGVAVALLLILLLAAALVRFFDKELVLRWGIFLGLVLIIALPILFTFTFQQASGDNFVRGFFNWNNSNPDTMDNYIVFYIKNLGIMFALSILVLVFGTKKQIRTMMPAVFLWLISEFVLFQPNPYDNNKLMLVSYFFFCVAAADFVWDILPALFKKAGEKAVRGIRIALVFIVAVIGTLAAALTMGREAVADFELYSADYVMLCEWIEENTEPDEVFLTANNHNNAIASLTGRNIVCGSGSFLYFHGLDYGQQEQDVRTMYEDPASRDDLLDQYNVSYIVIGPCENGNYSIPDLQAMAEQYEIIYNKNGIVVLMV